MRILKRILFGLLLFLVISVIGGYIYFKTVFKPAPSQLILSEKKASIPFQWLIDTINGEPNPYAAMLLPVTLKGCPRTFYMQFDLGAPTSLFYKNKLEAINRQFHNLSLQYQDGKARLKNYQFMLGGTRVTAKEIAAKQFDSSRINWTDTTTAEIIGTIGTDLFEDKVLVINYRGNNLLIGNNVPDDLSAKTKLADFKFENRRVLLPAIINAKQTDIFFDSGTSAFELMTDKKTWEQLARKRAKVDRYPASSWNNQLMVNTTETNYTITFNTAEIPLQHVTYIEGTSFLQRMFMKLGGVGGLTGNKLFVEKVVILDTKNKKFAIVD